MERFCTRQRAIIDDLVKQLHLEALGERDKQIDDLVGRKAVEAQALAEELRKASDAFFENALALARIGRPGSAPEGLTGRGLLGWTDSQIPKSSPFEKRIADALAFHLSALSRGAAALKHAARRPEYMPVNISDSQTFVALRSELPDFHLEAITVDEPEPVDLMAVVTN